MSCVIPFPVSHRQALVHPDPKRHIKILSAELASARQRIKELEEGKSRSTEYLTEAELAQMVASMLKKISKKRGLI